MSNKYLPDYLQPHDAEAVTRLVSEALRRGFLISVNDGEEETVKCASDPIAIFPAIGSTDMDHIRVHRADSGNGDNKRPRIGTFLLVWGNSPGETLADATIPHDEADRVIMDELFEYALKPWN